jgi:DNA-binding transcriptional regulator YiaG
MALIRNNHVFKGHKTLLGAKYVTYAEVELPTRYEIFSSSDSFDWGYLGSASTQLAFSILFQLSNETFAKKHASKFANEVIKKLNSRDWILSASEILNWIDEQKEVKQIDKEEIKNKPANKNIKKRSKRKSNIVQDICKEIGITQKQLAEVLEVPEGTISSWAVKNEIPRLGKKAIEFYIQNKKNQEIVDSYKNFVNLLHSA